MSPGVSIRDTLEICSSEIYEGSRLCIEKDSPYQALVT